MHSLTGISRQSVQMDAEQWVGVDCCWYAVYTRSRHEKVVRQALAEQSIQSFLPLRNIHSQWKDRRKWVQKPLFPGYIFVQAQQDQLWQVSETRGVAYIVGAGIEPVAVPDDQVQAIRSLVESPYPVIHWPLLTKGKRVRIIAGPLTGTETFIVERRDGTACHIVVTVELLGRSVAVEIDPRCVEPII
jgi:transcription antitermination factor NusG